MPGLPDRLQRIGQASPAMTNDPATAMALANSSLDDDEMTRIAEVHQGDFIVRQMVQQLQAAPIPDQTAQWGQMDSITKEMYQKYGYKPTQWEDPDLLHKFMRTVGEPVGKVVGTVLDPGHLVQKSLGSALHLAQRASDETLHAYRFGREVFFDGKTTSFGQMKESWDRTANGEKYWTESTLQDLRGIVGDEHFDLVQSLASGENEAQYLSRRMSKADPNFQSELLRVYDLTNQDKIREAINFLSISKISPGRDVASGLGMHPGDKGWDLITGGVDAAWRVGLDPTLILGKVNKGYKIGKYGLNPASMIEDIEKSRIALHAGKTDRYTQAAERIATGWGERTPESVSRLINEMPGIQHGLVAMGEFESLTGQAIKTADDVFDFYQSQVGIKAIVSGSLSRGMFPITTGKFYLPTATRFTPLRGAIKEGVEVRVDRGRFGNLDDLAEAGEVVVKGRWNPKRITAEGINSMSSMIPKRKFINPDQEDSVELVRQLLGFHMPKQFRDQILVNFLQDSANFSSKSQLIQGAIEGNLKIAGVMEHEKGIKFAQRFLGRFNDRYAALNLDKRILPDGRETRSALWSHQVASAWEIPEFRKTIRAAQDSAQWFQSSQNLYDSFMGQLWKPSVLLRVGFIPRAFGEELLFVASHYGPKALARGHLMNFAARNMEEPLAITRPILGMTRRLAEHAPGILKRPMSGIDVYAQAAESMTRRALKDKLADPLLKNLDHAAMRHMAMHNRIATDSFAENMSANSAIPQEINNDLEGLMTTNIRNADGEIQEVKMRLTKEYEDVEDPWTDSIWGPARAMNAMEAVANSPEGKLINDVAAKLLWPEHIAELSAKATNVGLEVSDRASLMALIPEEMPIEWDRFLQAAPKDLDEAGVISQGLKKARLENELAAKLGNTREAHRQANKTIKFIDSLTPRERYALYGRNGALDRHIASQQLADQGHNLLDPHNLPDDMAEEFFEAIGSSLDEANLSGSINDLLATESDDLESVIQATRNAGVSPEVLNPKLDSLYSKWKREGFAGIQTLNGRGAMLFDGGAVSIRTTVAAQEKAMLDRLYRAMDNRSHEEITQVVKELNASRLGRGDLEHTLQRADAGNSLIDGTPIAKPVAKNRTRVYTVTTPQSTAASTSQYIADGRLAETDAPFLAMSGTQAVDMGVSGVANQAWFTADYQQAKRLQASMNHAGSSVSVGYVDLPDEAFNRGRRFAQSEQFGGVAPLADVRETAQVFVPQEYAVHINPLPDNATLIDGQAVAGVDRAQILEELAALQVQDYSNLFSGVFDPDDARDLRELSHAIATKGQLSLEDLDGIKVGDLPKHMALPKLINEPDKNRLQKMTDWGFDKIGKAGNALVRHPLYNVLYSDSLNMVGPALRNSMTDPATLQSLKRISLKYGIDEDPNVLLHHWMSFPEDVRNAGNPIKLAREYQLDIPPQLESLTPADARKLNQTMNQMQYIEETIAQVVSTRAVREAIPYLDDHRLRTQFQERHRHLLPFQFAEAQFLKRWGRAVSTDPTIIRKLALTMQGLQHVGYITKNEFDEDIYTFPGTEFFMNAVSRGVQMLTGSDVKIPISNPFTGTLKYSAPGVDRVGIPSFGPVAGIGITLVKKLFPEVAASDPFRAGEAFMYGERGHTRGVMQQIMPTQFLNFYNAIVQDPEANLQYASALNQAMAYMEANDLAPGEDAPNDEKQEYFDRLSTHARTIVGLRAFLGFFTPSSPNFEVPDNLSKEFKEIMKDLSMEEAVGVFLARHPDAEAWTVFETKSKSGAPLGATAEVFKVLDESPQYFIDHPDAGPWLLPQSTSNDPYEARAYYESVAQGLRVRKGKDEMWRDIKFAEASRAYFDNKQKTDIALESVKNNPEAKKKINARWREWKEDYYLRHPVFAEDIQGTEAHQRRLRILSGMESALNDPDAPKIPHRQSMETMLTNFNRMRSALSSLAEDTTDSGRRKKLAIKDRFDTWVVTYTRTHPEVRAFYERVIDPENT